MRKSSHFISLREATKYCNYTQEYLSLRARQGKLKAVKIGRNWVTTQEWLQEYLRRVKNYKNKSYFKFHPLVVGILILTFLIPFMTFGRSFVFYAKDSFLNIADREKKSFETISKEISFKNTTLSDNFPGWDRLFPESKNSIDNISRSLKTSYSLSRGIRNFIITYLKVNSWLEKKSYAFCKKIETVFLDFGDRIFVSREREEPKTTLNPPPQEREGVIVIPAAKNDLAREEIKEKIKKAFSDEVIVWPEKNGESGIIKPVFKKGFGEDYIYILVPIKQRKY